tara:strand:+ start:56 stop:388 length:333 start_codon:yes stop_codon:yes gene_type:complete
MNEIGGKPIKKQYLLVGNGFDLKATSFSSKWKGDLKTTISPLLGICFFKEIFSIINLSFICNSGSIEPEGIYRGSAKKDLQEETKKDRKSNGPHSIIIFLKEKFIKFTEV